MKTKLALLVLCLSLMAGPAGAKLEVGIVPPDYLGKTPDNDEIRISQFRGSVVVVTFWASWCGPCRRELPVLDVLQKAAGSRAHIIAVNVQDTAQDYRIIRRQLKDSALTFTHDRNGKISEGYAVKSYPNLYVIDQTGTIAAVHVGFGDDSLVQIIDDINALLVAPPKPAAVPAAKA
jgi:thiol-disulfide isomerase/thioredoxin